MSWLVRSSVHFRLLVLGVAAGVIALGIVQLRSAPVDVLPEFTPPHAEVQTEALGLSAEEVEQLVTVPLEADLLNGVEGIDVIRSESVPGLSSIVMVFAPGTDIYKARQLVEERLTQAHALPNVSRPPTLLQPLSSSNRVLLVGLSSRKLSAIEQSVIARWTVRPRLMGVPGVANVAIWGMRDQQLQVQVDPERLRQRGVTLSQVVRSAGNAQVVSPLSFLEASTPGTGGFIETPQQRLQVRHLIEKIADPAELGKVPVDGTGGRLRLADVADIKVDHQPLIGDAVVAGGDGVMLVVEKFPGADTLAVTEGVEDALEALRPGLAGIRTDTSVFRPASYIFDALDNLWVSLVAGALLMLLVLLALRIQWRTVVLVAVVVPLSLLVAALLLRVFGQTLNALALAGLAAAVAVVVDEAVAPTQRVLRRLSERRDAGDTVPLTQLVPSLVVGVRRPLGYATLILLLAVLPVAVMGGRPGAFFMPTVVGYALALAAALVVALTVTPALLVLLFSRWRTAEDEPRVHWRIRRAYVAGLGRFTHSMRGVLLTIGICLVLGVATLPFLGVSLIPSFHDRDVLVRLEGAAGTSNARMTETARDVARRVADLPGVGDVGAHVGRAVTGDRVTDVSSSDVWVSIDSDADYDATMDAIEAVARDARGVRADVVTYSTQKLRDVGALNRGDNPVRGADLDVLTGVDRPLVVRVFGADYAELRRQADRVKRVMADVDGVVEPRVDQPETRPSIEIEVDLDRARAAGLTPGDVRRAEATLQQGIQVGSVFQQQKVFDVIVQGSPETRDSVQDLRSMLIDTPGGGAVRLGEVADVRVVDTPASIRRDAVSRRMDISADVTGRSLDAVASDLRDRLASTRFPMEYHAEVLEQGTSDELGIGRVVGFALGVAVAAYLLLQAAFRSWRLAGLVFAAVPVALVGGLVVALVDGAQLTLGSLLGLLAVLGLATRHSLSVVTSMQDVDPLPTESRAQLVHRGASTSVLPVVASSAAVAALVSPFAVLGSRPGLELLHPMALVLLGGLVSSAVVTLFVLPALYLHLAGTRDAPASDGEERRVDELEASVVAVDAVPGPRHPPAARPDEEPVA